MSNEPSPRDYAKALLDDGFTQEQVNKFLDNLFDDEKVPDKTDKTPDNDDGDHWDKDDIPSEEQSDPPMDSKTEPKSPEDDSYSPERNVDEAGGTVGSDPQCKPIFNPTVARMKRGKTYEKWKVGGREGYISVSPPNTDLRVLRLRDAPDSSGEYREFKGKMDVIVSTGGYTRIFMPTEESYIIGYSTTEPDCELEFYTDHLSNTFVRSKHRKYDVTLQWTVFCKWSKEIGNLLYYYQDYDDDMTLHRLYELSEGYHNYNDSVVIQFRRLVPGLLRMIDEDYFGDLIDALERSSMPGMLLNRSEPASLAYLGALKKYNFRSTMQKLAGYMMSFGCNNIPEDGDMVVDCVSSREGSCRNRALAFFVIGNVIGIPTRYCCSDCHAYVEVYFPNVDRWIGMDLGGCPPPQPKGPQKKPKEQVNVLKKFEDNLLSMGWSKGEERFKIAINSATAVEISGGA